MKVGDLVKVKGGKLRPEWYGETGIIVSDSVPHTYEETLGTWYEVSLPAFGPRIIRNDMLVVLNESR